MLEINVMSFDQHIYLKCCVETTIIIFRIANVGLSVLNTGRFCVKLTTMAIFQMYDGQHFWHEHKTKTFNSSNTFCDQKQCTNAIFTSLSAVFRFVVLLPLAYCFRLYFI